MMVRLVRMDSNRRVTLPLELLALAGIAVGEDLVASTSGDAVVLRSRSDLRQTRNEVSAGFGTAGPRQDVPPLREDRDADDAALDRRIGRASDDPDTAGVVLLHRLGL